MTEDEQLEICKQLAIISMWGHGWVGSVATEKFDLHVHAPRPWHEVYRENADRMQREHIGMIDEATILSDHLRRGYWLTNFDEHGAALFNPDSMGGGLYKYVSKPLAEKYKRYGY